MYKNNNLYVPKLIIEKLIIQDLINIISKLIIAITRISNHLT